MGTRRSMLLATALAAGAELVGVAPYAHADEGVNTQEDGAVTIG